MSQTGTPSTSQQPSEPTPSHASGMLIALYMWADMRWTRLLGRLLGQLTADPTMTPTMLVGRMQVEARHITDTLGQRTPMLLDTIEQSILRSMQAETRRTPPLPPAPPAILPLPAPRPPFDPTIPLWQRAVEAIHTDLQTELRDVRERILRQPNDLYKLTAAGAAVNAVTDNGHTITDAQRTMMRDLLTHGITGFVDNAGRHWQLSSYVEMAVRTATMRALNEAHIQVMTGIGVTLFTVPTHMHTCPLCHAWQGRILSLTPDPRADATIDQARAQGLWHPNCTHILTAWHEGDAKPPASPWTERDQQLWESSQLQRSLESRIRMQKRILMASSDPQLRTQARARIRAYQARIRDLTGRTGLLRRRRREQSDLGLH